MLSPISARRAWLALAALSFTVLAACQDSGTATPPVKRTIYLNAVELRGTAAAAKEPFPTTRLPEGGSYALVEPSGASGEWQVAAYAWAPVSFVVVEDDEVTLQVLGVAGAVHVTQVENHTGQFTVKRGELITVAFKAGKPGIYRVVCITHQPAMSGQMVVLPAGG